MKNILNLLMMMMMMMVVVVKYDDVYKKHHLYSDMYNKFCKVSKDTWYWFYVCVGEWLVDLLTYLTMLYNSLVILIWKLLLKNICKYLKRYRFLQMLHVFRAWCLVAYNVRQKLLTHYTPVLLFYTPWKYLGFLMFSGVIESNIGCNGLRVPTIVYCFL